MESLDPRVRLAWVVGSLVPAAVLAVVGVAAARFGAPVSEAAAVALAGVVVVLGVVAAVFRYRIWRFEVREDSLYLVRGVFTRIDTSVPYVRVQHVDTRRGPVERALGLASVVVYTAGSRGADITIPGLTPDRAGRLREQLRDLATESEFDAV
ncbi:PH domain-containing protein [Halobaculum sp. CBA1158]|uniref:PH domain-containing protein n=1 Tax=Halobaculum sp. CBA1158 TaxID=2904243 RepID=UPI001F1F572B|nr:PH domain-containing protein [Halobaculum sp. CBA1158]UIO98756.1 PH domain-containing protein [Halobaculum sp. CBA1158]